MRIGEKTKNKLAQGAFKIGEHSFAAKTIELQEIPWSLHMISIKDPDK